LGGDLTLAFNFNDPLVGSVRAGYLKETDSVLDNLEVAVKSLVLGVQYALRGKGRLRAELERYSVAADKPTAIPYLMADGLPRGKSSRFSLNGTANLTNNLILTLTLFARREAQRSPFTTAQMELRTQF